MREPPVVFVTYLSSAETERLVRRAIAGLREFGGVLASCPVLAFAPHSLLGIDIGLMTGVDLVGLRGEPELARYPFGAKVTVCAQAEAQVPHGTESLVWLGSGCLVFRPPELFSLRQDCDVAFRPVHIANVGSPRSGPLDEYWQAVYKAVDTKDGDGSVESLLDRQRLRPYYNTHCFAVNPALGLMGSWLESFRSLVADEAFQSGPCRDELHRIFLHQAVLSAYVTKSVAPGRVRILPPAYSYPLHFHSKLADTQRVRAMNEITVAAYENDGDLEEVPADEPLRSWLARERP
ncbi:hypothetical protein JXD38_04530 [candidate division WOR-3 bacterium]|nr:hypothetical protein [candidate division WOR-3 bacterium]